MKEGKRQKRNFETKKKEIKKKKRKKGRKN